MGHDVGDMGLSHSRGRCGVGCQAAAGTEAACPVIVCPRGAGRVSGRASRVRSTPLDTEAGPDESSGPPAAGEVFLLARVVRFEQPAEAGGGYLIPTRHAAREREGDRAAYPEFLKC